MTKAIDVSIINFLSIYYAFTKFNNQLFRMVFWLVEK